MAVCLLVSALPMIIFDLRYTGNWVGVPANGGPAIVLSSPLWGVIGNVFCLTIQNLKPPVFPIVNSWNAAMHHFLETPFGAHFTGFEDFGRLTFGVAETTAGLGAGICLLIFISFWVAWSQRRTSGTTGVTRGAEGQLRLLRWTPWLLLLLFMAKVGAFGNARYLAPYYFFFFPSLLIGPGHSALVRRRWWQSCALLVMISAVILLVISRDRPVFPAQTVIGWLQAKYPDTKLVVSVSRTYAETPAFEDQRSVLRTILPPDAPVLGYAAVDGVIESCLWLPYGQRQVQRILPGDSPEQTRQAGIHYVVLENNLLIQTHQTLQQWLARYHGMVSKEWEFIANPYEPPQRFYLVHLQYP